VNAIKKLPKNNNKKKINIDIYINRSSKNGGIKSAQPCHKCIKHMDRLKYWGYRIKNVIYPSNDNNNIIIIKFENLLNQENKHISHRFKHEIKI
jgi:hypothetical protein